jgi:hypothetical protein
LSGFGEYLLDLWDIVWVRPENTVWFQELAILKAAFPWERIFLVYEHQAIIIMTPAEAHSFQRDGQGGANFEEPLERDRVRVEYFLQKRPAGFMKEEAMSMVDLALLHGPKLIFHWTIIAWIIPPSIEVDGRDESPSVGIVVETNASEDNSCWSRIDYTYQLAEALTRRKRSPTATKLVCPRHIAGIVHDDPSA